jgi:hypothetical protein
MDNEKILLASIFATAIFILVKTIERKIKRKRENDDETLATSSRHGLKTIFHDGIFAFISCLFSFSIVENFWPLLQTTFDSLATGKVMDFGPPKVFSGNPDF